ncbi:MAG: hypothetical protein ABIQ97_07215 [Lysobacteraceae bacterium]
MRHARQHADTHAQTRTRERRQRLAIEAARLMSEDGIRDFHQAKLKAAQRLGILDDPSLPRNSEIEQALRDYQRLFCADSQPALLRVRREAAARAMEFFWQFAPRLVGSVLDGTADVHSAVCLHLHTDQPDGVGEFLREQGIPAEAGSRHLWIDREREADVPVWLFSAEDLSFDLTVLSHDALRQAPLDRSGNRPMRRASLVALRALLNTESGELDVLDPHRRRA